MWRTLLAMLLLYVIAVRPSDAYSRFGQMPRTSTGSAPMSINDQILSGSNIQYYGRFRSGQDDVLNRYFQRLT